MYRNEEVYGRNHNILNHGIVRGDGTVKKRKGYGDVYNGTVWVFGSTGCSRQNRNMG